MKIRRLRAFFCFYGFAAYVLSRASLVPFGDGLRRLASIRRRRRLCSRRASPLRSARLDAATCEHTPALSFIFGLPMRCGKRGKTAFKRRSLCASFYIKREISGICDIYPMMKSRKDIRLKSYYIVCKPTCMIMYTK